MSVNLSNSSSS